MHCRLKNFLFRLILVTAAILLSLALAELILIILRGPAHESMFKEEWGQIHQIYEPLALPFLRTENINNKTQFFFNRTQTENRSPVNAEKPKDEFRIVVIGESVAEQFGYWFSNSPYAKNIISSMLPKNKVNIINAGVGAYTSSQILSAAREITKKLEPDFVLILMGNNIHTSRVEWFINRSPASLKYLYLNSWVARIIIDRLYTTNNIFGFNEFRKDYEAIARLLNSRNIPFAAFTLPVNYADFAPDLIFRSDHIIPYMLNSLGRYKETIDIISEKYNDASLNFFKGQALRGLGKYREARGSYISALKKNTFGRATPSVNDLIRNIAEEYGALLVEVDRMFENISENGLLGMNFLYDDCHWYYSMNKFIFNELAQLIESQYPDYKISANLKKIDLNLLMNNIEKDVKAKKINHFIADTVGQEDLNWMAKLLFRVFVFHRKKDIINILNVDPESYLLTPHIKSCPWTAQIVDKEIENVWHITLTNIGEALRQEGFNADAIDFFDAAIIRKSDYWWAYFFRSLAHISKGNKDEAIQDLKSASEFCYFEIPVASIINKFFYN